MEHSLVISNLTKTYRNGTRAVDGLTLTIEQDDFVIILGPSGAGKSTLLRCINRLLEPTSGHIELDGHDIAHVSGRRLRRLRERVGMIFQQFNLLPRLTVLENVLAGRLSHCRNTLWKLASLTKFFPESEKEYAFECLKKVHIEELAFQRADNLSGGQQQRVAIARALAQDPVVFLADEPVASLDPASSRIVMETLQDIHESQGLPVIVNLHQVELARKYAKRIVGMSDGGIVFDGHPRELTHDEVQRIYGLEADRAWGRLPSRPPEPSPPHRQLVAQPVLLNGVTRELEPGKEVIDVPMVP